MNLISYRTALIHTENAFKLGPYIRALEEAGHKVIKCNLGEPDFPLPTHVRDEVKAQLDKDNVHYTDPQGILSLRQAIAKYMGDARGIKYSAEQVVVFPGGKPPIGLCQQTYCNPGHEVICPSPGFPIYESFIHYVGAVAPSSAVLLNETFALDKHSAGPTARVINTAFIWLKHPHQEFDHTLWCVELTATFAFR